MNNDFDDTFITLQKGREQAPRPAPKKEAHELVPHSPLAKESKGQLYELVPLHISEATRLHAMMREMKDMDEKLQQTRRSYSERIAAVREGQREFMEKQAQTIEDLRKLRWFIISLDDKRVAAEQRTKSEQEKLTQLTQNLDELTEQLAKTKERRAAVIERYKKHMQTKTYLESILSDSSNPNSAQFTAIEDILNRYKVLDGTHRDLKRHGKHLQLEIDRIHTDILQLKKQKQNDLLVGNGKQANLSKQLDQAVKAASNLELETATHSKLGGDSSRRYAEIIQAIENLYTRAQEYPTSKNKEPVAPPSAPPSSALPPHTPLRSTRGPDATVETTPGSGGAAAPRPKDSTSSPAPVSASPAAAPSASTTATSQGRDSNLSLAAILKQIERVGNNVSDMLDVVAELNPDRGAFSSRSHGQRRRRNPEHASAPSLGTTSASASSSSSAPSAAAASTAAGQGAVANANKATLGRPRSLNSLSSGAGAASSKSPLNASLRSPANNAVRASPVPGGRPRPLITKA